MTERFFLQNPEYDFKAGILREYEEYQYDIKHRKNLLNTCRELFSESGRYLGSILHDSAVLSFEYQKNDYIRITFSDIRYDDFCSALKNLEGVSFPCKDQVFPVVFEFYGLKKCLVHWVNRNGKLLPLKTEKYLPKINEFLYDEIQAVGKDYIDLVLHFCTTMWKTQRYNLFLHIIAERFSIIEKQREILVGLFEEKYSPLLDAFQKEIENGEFFDYGISEKFIQARRNLIRC